MNKERSSGISAVVGIVILILLVLILSAGVLFAAQTLVGDQPQQMVGGMTEERVSPYEQRVSLVSQGNADDLTVVSPLGTEYNLSQVGDSQLYLAVSPSVSGAQDPQILGVKNGERQVLTSSEIRDGIPADIVVDKYGTGEYTSIRNALNNTQPGDIIVVEKATYNENIDVPKNISLIAEHGTVIQDQNPAEPVVSIDNGHVTLMNFIIDADPIPGDNHYASHGILVKGNNTEIIGNTIRNATSPAGDSAGLRVEGEGVVARYNNFKNSQFSLSVASGVGSVQLCSNQLDGGLHGSFSKSTYETFVMRNYWNKGVPSTVLNNVLSDRPNVTATDVSRNAVNFNKVFETSNNREILAAKAFPGTRLFGGAPCGIKLSFTNQGSSVNVVNASINYEIQNVTYNVTFNEDNTATLTRGNNSTTTSYSVSGGDTSWDTGESLSLSSPSSDSSGSSGTSGVWSSGDGGGGGASFWGGGTGGGLSGGSLFGSGGGGSFWGISSGTTSSDVKVTKSPTNNTTASVEQSPPENVTETEKENVTVDLGADFKATVGDEISLDAIVTGGTSPYNYTWELGDGTTSYSKSVTHIYDSTGNYTISLNVTDSKGQNDTDSITVWIQESTTTTKTKNETLTLNEQVSNLSPGETLAIPSGSYNAVNVDVPGVTLVGDGSVTINGLSILSDNVKVKSVEVTGPLSVTGSDYSMYDSTIDNTGGTWAIEVYETGAYFDGVTGEANNGMYIDRALQDIQFTSGSLTANSGQGVLVKKHTGSVEIIDSSITATGAGIYREHGSQLYLARNSISGSPDTEIIKNQPPQPVFTYNDAPLDNGSYGVKFDPSSTTDPEGEPITSMKWDFDNDNSWEAYGDGVKQYEYPSYGTYTVTLSVTDYHGVTVNLERKITINEYYFAFSANKPTVNTSETVEFNATTSVPESNIDYYNMDYDGDGTAEEQVNSLPTTHTYTTAGDYSPQIELVTTNSGTLINSTSVKVLAPPTATFTMNTSVTNPGKDVKFNASASTDPDGGPLSYDWDFGDGTLATGESLTHAYSNTGDYTVSLTVTDDEGEASTTTKTISITSPDSVPTNGLIAHWPMNDSGTPGTVVDSAGSHNGSIHGASYTTINGMTALSFDGSNDHTDSYGNIESKNITISLWVKPETVPSNSEDTILWHGNPGTTDDNYGFTLRNGEWRFYRGPSTSVFVGSPEVGKWYFLTMTTSSSEGNMYINGSLKQSVSGSNFPQNNRNHLLIGAYDGRNGPKERYHGSIRDVRIYNRTLSKSEVQTLYDTGDAPPTASFTYSPSLPNTGETISFDASSSSDDRAITSYEWGFDGDGTTDATGETVTHSYSSTGDKTVTLTVTDDNGGTNSTTKTISVTKPTSALTWETATDWDTAVNETGVVHENTPHTDYDDASRVKMGYSTENMSNTVGYWPLQEDSGTAHDISGNGNNATTTQVSSYDASGILGSTAMDFDGSDDYIKSHHWHGTPLTEMVWVKPESTTRQVILRARPDGSTNYAVEIYNNEFRMQQANGAIQTGVTVQTGKWYQLINVIGEQGENQVVYVNGQNEGVLTVDTGYSTTSDSYIGRNVVSKHYFDGKISHARIWDTALSPSKVQDLYGVVNNTSTLTTSTKSFSEPSNPDLETTHSLNGQSITVNITGSPGTPESETESVILNSSSTYDLAWSQNHTEYQVTVEMNTSDPTKTPTLDSVKLVKTDHPPVNKQLGPTGGLTAYYEFEGDATDSANGYDGADYTSVSYTQGIVGTKAKQFDGNDDYVQAPAAESFKTDFTISFWYKSSTLPDPSGFVNQGDHADSGDWTAGQKNGDFKFIVNGDGNDIRVTPSFNPEDGNWHHIVWVIDSTTSGKLYTNGTFVGSDTAGIGIDGTGDIYMGKYSTAYTPTTLDDVRIYNRTLSDSEIQDLYNATK